MRRNAEADGQRSPQKSRKSGSSRVDDDQSGSCNERVSLAGVATDHAIQWEIFSRSI